MSLATNSNNDSMGLRRLSTTLSVAVILMAIAYIAWGHSVYLENKAKLCTLPTVPSSVQCP